MNRANSNLSNKLIIIHIKHLVPTITVSSSIIPKIRIRSSPPKFAPKFRNLTINKGVYDWQCSILKVPSQIHLALSFNSRFPWYLISGLIFYTLLSLEFILVFLSYWLLRWLFGQCREICSLFHSPEKYRIPCVLPYI